MKHLPLFCVLSIMMGALAACHQKEAANAPTQPIESSNPASSSDFAAQRAEFMQGCVQSASPQSAASETSRLHQVGQVCDCVYEEGVKAYGSERDWVNAMNQFNQKQPNAPIAEKAKAALETCFQKYPIHSATASAPQ